MIESMKRRGRRVVVSVVVGGALAVASAMPANAGILLGSYTGSPGYVGIADFSSAVCSADYQATRNPQYSRTFLIPSVSVTKAGGASLSQQTPYAKAYVQRWNGSQWLTIHESFWYYGLFVANPGPLGGVPMDLAAWTLEGGVIPLSQGGAYRVYFDIRWMSGNVQLASRFLYLDRHSYTTDSTTVPGAQVSTYDGLGWCYIR